MQQDELEGRVLGALQLRLMEPALLQEFCAEYTAYRNKLHCEKKAALIAAGAEHEKSARNKENLIQMVKVGVPADEAKNNPPRIAPRHKELESLLAEKGEGPVLLHPNMSEFYRRQVAGLAATLNAKENWAESADPLRPLVERITRAPIGGPTSTRESGAVLCDHSLALR